MKLNIRYLLYKSKSSRTGRCPLRCRITFSKKRKEFSTGIFIHPSSWDSKQQSAKPPNDANDIINTQISLIKNNIHQAFLLLQIQQDRFTVQDIYITYKGEKLTKDYNVVEYFKMHLKHLKRLIGIDIKQITWNKSYYVKNNVQSFIK